MPAADGRRYRKPDADRGGPGYYLVDAAGRGSGLAGDHAEYVSRRPGRDWLTGSADGDAGFAGHVGIDLRGDPRARHDHANADHADHADDADYADHATGSHRRALDTERRHTGQYAHVNPGRHAHVHGDRRACQQPHGPGHRHEIGAGYRRPTHVGRR